MALCRLLSCSLHGSGIIALSETHSEEPKEKRIVNVPQGAPKSRERKQSQGADGHCKPRQPLSLVGPQHNPGAAIRAVP